MKTFTLIEDPGHAWLCVSLDDVAAARLEVGQFSPYSFIDGSTLYLEEDVDAALFILAHEVAHGEGSFRVRHHAVDAFDRGMTRCPATSYDFETTQARCKAMLETLRSRAPAMTDADFDEESEANADRQFAEPQW